MGWDVTRVNKDFYHDINKSPVLLYNSPTEDRILQMTEPKNNINKPKPFLQRIQLKGKSGSVVRATGQVDDGAMRNCISLDRWKKYGHCLDNLSKSNTIISVANTTEIKSIGTWMGTVQVGGTGALSRFEIFDCKGAFDVILGKPWLKEVRAQHDYVTDRITIGETGQQEVISNILNTPEDGPRLHNPTTEETTPAEQAPLVETAEKPETHPEEQLVKEWTRISQMDALGETTQTKETPDNETKKPTHSETRIEQLRNHLDTLREMVKNASKTGPEENVEMQNIAVNAMGDVTKDEFKINRGTNTSARVQNAFDET